jgi:hypothetical protein
MAKDKDENGDGGKTENVLAEAMKMLAENQRMMIENAPKRVITQDSPEYNDRLRAEGYFDYFPKPVYQNGHEAEPKGLSEQTRERAAGLVPGKYLGGKVTVEASPNGGVHIKYKSKTVEDRMSQPWRDFTDLVDRVWAEMTVSV